MADTKISALSSATTPLAGTEVVPIVQSGATVKTPVSAFMGYGPTFSAYRGASSQSISNATYTKVQINTEEWDTASCFDPTTNFRFTPTLAGYYQVSGNVNYDPAATGKFFCIIYKNGTAIKGGTGVPFVATQYLTAAVSALVYLDGSTDYIELYTYQSSGGALTLYDSQTFTFFQAALVRSA